MVEIKKNVQAETRPKRNWILRIVDSFLERGTLAAFSAMAFKAWTAPPRGLVNKGILFQYLDKIGGIAHASGFVSNEFRSESHFHGMTFSLVSKTIRRPISTRETSRFLCGNTEKWGTGFEFPIGDLPLGTYHAEIPLEDGRFSPCEIVLGPRFPLTFRYRNQWIRLSRDKAFRMNRNGTFVIFRPSWIQQISLEIGFLAELLWHRTAPETLAALLRTTYWIWRPFHRKRYWIFSDKLSNPIDSAYSVAKALLGNREFLHEKIDPFYLIDGKHSLRIRLPRKLKTVRYLSLRHRLLFLAAEAHVTSEGGFSPLVPLAPYADLTAWQLRISTLHGIVHHDLSRIYGRDFNNFNLMITGVEREAEYERHGLWGYKPEDVVCTGLPRWDNREADPKRKIYFVFTWRNNLVEDSDPITKERKFGALLENSEYKSKLQSLLANPRLRTLAKEHGYSLEFLPHPLMRNAISFFQFPEYVHIVPENVPYEDMYREASIAVTDYSSIAMDMAYLGKPVVYYQFDHDEFYATQGYTESFFSWENDGFGPVIQSENEVVDAIERILDARCVRDEEYERRATAFFPPRDKENGLRACRAIFSKITRCNKQ